jgi:hypothetical protein
MPDQPTPSEAQPVCPTPTCSMCGREPRGARRLMAYANRIARSQPGGEAPPALDAAAHNDDAALLVNDVDRRRVHPVKNTMHALAGRRDSCADSARATGDSLPDLQYALRVGPRAAVGRLLVHLGAISAAVTRLGSRLAKRCARGQDQGGEKECQRKPKHVQ